MTVLEQIALGWQCLLHALGLALRPALWGPWLVLGLAQAMVLAALGGFAHPALSWLMAPLVVRLAGEEALHYPSFFRVLPAVFARADVAVAALAGAVIAGASIALFADAFAGRVPRASAAWRRALSRAPALVLVNLPVTAIALALPAIVALAGPGLVTRIALPLALAVVSVVQAWFLFASAFVVLENRGAWPALAALPGAMGRAGGTALVLSAATLIPPLLVQPLVARSDTIVSRGVPELVAGVVLAQAAVALASAFVLTGGATLAFQSALARPREEAAA
jgi:hypothetical protein